MEDRDKRTLFFKNLTYSLTEETLEENIKNEFAAAMEAGTIDHIIAIAGDEVKQKSVFILKERDKLNDRGQPRSKGMAFVTLQDEADVEKAIEILNGKEFEGRAIYVEKKKSFSRPSTGFDGAPRRNNFDDSSRRSNIIPMDDDADSENMAA